MAILGVCSDRNMGFKLVQQSLTLLQRQIRDVIRDEGRDDLEADIAERSLKKRPKESVDKRTMKAVESKHMFTPTHAKRRRRLLAHHAPAPINGGAGRGSMS